MKTRNGFVSNSSSSSFVIALPHVPKSPEDLSEMLYKSPGNSRVEALIAELLFDDLKIQDPATSKELDEVFLSGYLNSDPKLPRSGSWQENYKAWNALLKTNRTKVQKQFMEEVPDGSLFYIVEYSDDHTDGAFMEHNIWFSKTKTRCFNHH